MTDHDQRERHIINTASKLLEQEGNLDGLTIAAAYFFRFDSKIHSWVTQIRSAMNKLIGKSGDAPLSRDNSIKLELHLRKNYKAEYGISSDEGFYLKNYLPVNNSLKERIQTLPFETDNDESQINQQELLLEFKLTDEIYSQLEEIIRAYKLIPLRGGFSSNVFSRGEVEERYQTVIRWVMHGDIVPQFIWPIVQFNEIPTEERWKRLILPIEVVGISPFTDKDGSRSYGNWQELEDGSRRFIEYETPKSRSITIYTRIRTWTIYYLTNRGGGRLSEEKAVKKWNDTFENVTSENSQAVIYSQITNYQRYRNKILAGE